MPPAGRISSLREERRAGGAPDSSGGMVMFNPFKREKANMIHVEFRILKLASGFIGVGVVGGMQIRGGRRSTAFEAAQSFFLVLSGSSGNTDDAAIAVDML